MTQNKTRQRLFGLVLMVTCWGVSLPGISAASTDERLTWWRDARFGMFIHWGPVSLTGQEIGWARGAQIPIEEYDQLYKKFNPTHFDADAWVAAAKDAGMKYVVLTTKHHDGFCLWDTEQTDFNIMRSPFGREKQVTLVKVRIDEAYAPRVQKFELQYRAGSDWKTILTGTTLGRWFQQAFSPVTAQEYRLNILEATDGPTLYDIEFFEK